MAGTAPWISALSRAPGSIAVTITGYDTVLTCDVAGFYWYRLADLELSASAWHEVVARSKITVAERGGRVTVDLGHLSSLKSSQDKNQAPAPLQPRPQKREPDVAASAAAAGVLRVRPAPDGK